MSLLYQYSSQNAVIIKIIKIMSTQQNEHKKLLEDAHLRLLKTKALILDAQMQVVKMKALALRARMQALKNLTLIGRVDFHTTHE
ncbi:hypothetical protein GCM10027442_24510 [Emticicia fontis]